MTKKILILGDEPNSDVLHALQLEQARRGRVGDVSFATIGTPTPKLDSVGGAVPAHHSITLLWTEHPSMVGGWKGFPPRDGHDG